jgi:hypothetical protein
MRHGAWDPGSLVSRMGSVGDFRGGSMQEWSYCCPAGDEGGKVPLQVANVLWYESMAKGQEDPPTP